jgi:3-deoxy-D-manno-octulosonic-acid transferase
MSLTGAKAVPSEPSKPSKPNQITLAQRFARGVYSAIWLVLLPALPLRLWWRARREAGYAQAKRERFGFGYAASWPKSRSPADKGRLVWLHAVSLGETRAATPLIEALLAALPEVTLLLTHMTATGREAGAQLALKHSGRILQAWLPYDAPWCVKGFFNHFEPHLGVVMETEVWPNLLHQAARRRIPMVLANARLSAKSARGYALLALLSQPALASFAQVLAQGAGDAERLQTAGARRVQALGNMKFDAAPDAAQCLQGKAWRASLARPVVIAASTREGEEALLLEQLAQCSAAGALLLIVPRHPQRFEAVAQLLSQHSVNYKKYSELVNEYAQHQQYNNKEIPQVILGDAMGNMAFFYSASDVAIMGGSLLNFGSQNLIEACACGCPVVLGPSTYNFADAAQAALECGAAMQETEPRGVLPLALQLLGAPARLAQAQQQAHVFAASQRGSVAQHLAVLQGYL